MSMQSKQQDNIVDNSSVLVIRRKTVLISIGATLVVVALPYLFRNKSSEVEGLSSITKDIISNLITFFSKPEEKPSWWLQTFIPFMGYGCGFLMIGAAPVALMMGGTVAAPVGFMTGLAAKMGLVTVQPVASIYGMQLFTALFGSGSTLCIFSAISQRLTNSAYEKQLTVIEKVASIVPDFISLESKKIMIYFTLILILLYLAKQVIRNACPQQLRAANPLRFFETDDIDNNADPKFSNERPQKK